MKRLVVEIVTVLAFVLSPIFIGWGCNVPVFRYALERWPLDYFQVLICYENVFTQDQQALANQLIQKSISGEGYNYDVQLVDLNSKEGEWVKSNAPAHLLDQPPFFAVFYPQSVQRGMLLETGTFSKEHTTFLSESPLRIELAQRLLKGETAVWIFLDSDDPEADDKAFAFLQSQLHELERTTKPPELDNVSMSDNIELDATAGELPVKFSTLRLKRNDPQEQFLVKQLLLSEEDLMQYNEEPMVFPVFGRGRILYALVGDGITRDNMQEAVEFLVGPCSCVVKDLNPGTDLLMPINWEEAMFKRLVQDRQIPLPYGLAQVESTSATIVADINDRAANNADTQTMSQVSPIQTKQVDGVPPERNILLRNIFIGIGILVLINIIFLLTLRKRTAV